MNASPLQHVWSILPETWRTLCRERGIPAYRGEQIATALYQHQAQNWRDVTLLPQALRESLAQEFDFTPLTIDAIEQATDGVRKLLLRCHDGALIETVLIPSKGRLTQCISTQVGCKYRCAFCASGQKGLTRHLDSAEIVGQVMAACQLLRTAPDPNLKPIPPGTHKSTFQRPSNIVVMGIGEPFDNYTQMMLALRILNSQKGLSIGARHITISTCGVVPGIQSFAQEGIQFELSVSLHAPSDGLRSQLMPVNQRWNLEELMQAARDYFRQTNRLITFEYTLIKDVNDTLSHALALINLLRGTKCKINLIPLSPVAGFAGERPQERQCLAFLDALMKAKIPTTLRKSRGREVNAACGQLRLQKIASSSAPESALKYNSQTGPTRGAMDTDGNAY